MTTEKEIDDAIQAYLTEQCYGEGAQPDGLMIAAEAGWRLLRAERDAFERDYTAVGERNKELHDMYFATLALAEERQATIDLAARVQDFHVGQIHDLRALAERRAGVTEAAQRFRAAHDAWSHRFMPQPGDTRGDEAERAQAALFAAVDALAAAPPETAKGAGA